MSQTIGQVTTTMHSFELGQADTGFAPGARLIFDAVSRVINMRLGITPDNAVKMANTEIEPDHRFYGVEYDHASIMLAEEFPHVQQQAWRMLLQNNMGYRIVQIPICRYRYVIDPVTKECVPEYRPPEVPTPAPTPPPEVPKKAEMSGMVLLAIAALAFLFARGR